MRAAGIRRFGANVGVLELLLAPAALLAHAHAILEWPTVAALPVPALTADQPIRDALPVRAGEAVARPRS